MCEYCGCQETEPIFAELTAERDAIERVLADLAGGQLCADWTDRARTVADLLFEHILKEQDGVFPAALTTLTGEGWQRLAAAHGARHLQPNMISIA